MNTIIKILIFSFICFYGFCSNTDIKLKPNTVIIDIKKDSSIVDSTQSKIDSNPKIKKPFFTNGDYEIMAMVSGILAICAFLGIVIFILSLSGIYLAVAPIFVLTTPINLLLAIILGKISKRKIKNKKWAKLGIILGIIDLIITTLIGSLILYIVFNWRE